MRLAFLTVWLAAALLILVTGCGHLIVAPWREHACRADGGVPYSYYRMFGQYEGTTCYASDPLAPGGAKVLWSR